MSKNVVVIVMGATGSGKSKLALDLAAHFPAEIINSDKIQVYAGGLNVLTNMVTSEESATVPHHLLGLVDPEEDFDASDFRYHAMHAVESIIGRGHLPIVAGGSNSYIKELIEGNGQEFLSKYACCFIWVDVDLPVLHSYVSDRVDRMVEKGLVDEVREIFDPTRVMDYSKGVRRAIGVPEMDSFLRAEATGKETNDLDMLLSAAINEIKVNTCKLACNQINKIKHLQTLRGWNVHRVDATEALKLKGREADEAWEKKVRKPSIDIVRKFLIREVKIKTRNNFEPARHLFFLLAVSLFLLYSGMYLPSKLGNY